MCARFIASAAVPYTEPCRGYLVVHLEGTLLFDTGMGRDPWVDQHYAHEARPGNRR